MTDPLVTFQFCTPPAAPDLQAQPVSVTQDHPNRGMKLIVSMFRGADPTSQNLNGIRFYFTCEIISRLPPCNSDKPLVYGSCLRIPGNAQDAEEASWQ